MIRRKNDDAMKMDEDITSLKKHLQEKQVTFLHVHHFITMKAEAKVTNVACSCCHSISLSA